MSENTINTALPTIFLVEVGEYSDRYIEGAYADRDLAQSVADRLLDGYVAEYPLNGERPSTAKEYFSATLYPGRADSATDPQGDFEESGIFVEVGTYNRKLPVKRVFAPVIIGQTVARLDRIVAVAETEGIARRIVYDEFAKWKAEQAGL